VIGCKRGWIRKSMVVQNIHDKKNDVILYVKVWIIIIYEYIILNAFQILQQNKTKRNRKKKTTTTKRLVI
jgi:hypothetical protein